jgi:hypothetical protein
MPPYLEGQVRLDFDAWHAALRRRFERDLTFAEIRKGVQALSSLYVSRRSRLSESAAVFDGEGKRAAFALYYAPLHFIITHHVVGEIGFDAVPAAKLWDLGCGTGAGGAAWGTALRSALHPDRLPEERNEERTDPREPSAHPTTSSGESRGPGSPEPSRRTSRRSPLKVIGVDRSGFALEEAAGTYHAFRLRAETRRIDIGDSTGGSPVVAIRSHGHHAGDRSDPASREPKTRRIGDEHEIPRAGLGGRPGRPDFPDRPAGREPLGFVPSHSGRERRRRREASGIRADDAILLAFTVNELSESAREGLLHHLLAGEGTSRPLLVVEPITKRAVPWWSRWERALGEEALLLHSIEWRGRFELPEWIAEMDQAAGLDHSELTARVLGVVG